MYKHEVIARAGCNRHIVHETTPAARRPLGSFRSECLSSGGLYDWMAFGSSCVNAWASTLTMIRGINVSGVEVAEAVIQIVHTNFALISWPMARNRPISYKNVSTPCIQILPSKFLIE